MDDSRRATERKDRHASGRVKPAKAGNAQVWCIYQRAIFKTNRFVDAVGWGFYSGRDIAIPSHLCHNILREPPKILLSDRILQHGPHLQLSRIPIREAGVLAQIVLQRFQLWDDLQQGQWCMIVGGILMVPGSDFRDKRERETLLNNEIIQQICDARYFHTTFRTATLEYTRAGRAPTFYCGILRFMLQRSILDTTNSKSREKLKYPTHPGKVEGSP